MQETWVGKIPWRREWLPAQVFWSAECHRQSMGSQHTYLYIFFFLLMKTFNIYSLRNFQIYNTVSLTIVTMLYIPTTYLFYNNKF